MFGYVVSNDAQFVSHVEQTTFLYTQEQKEFHVFFLNCYPNHARKLICEVLCYKVK